MESPSEDGKNNKDLNSNRVDSKSEKLLSNNKAQEAQSKTNLFLTTMLKKIQFKH